MREPVAVSRRSFMAMSAGLVLLQTPARPPVAPPPGADSLADGGAAGQLADPDRAGRPLDPVTARDNDAAIQAIEKRLQCTCGCGLDVYTCRTTDFSCTYSPGYHRQVLALAASGMTGDEIVAEFVKEHGESILMAPPRRGFALVGYYGPWTLVGLAAVGLVLLLRAWARRAAGVAVVESPASPVPTPAELELVRRELQHFES
ncbi:MAG TPA: cytochrome c-type biogenesis protein CcmH [Gemmatimonadales bacterium]|nr:cytochrome c-type biogenesis protein CcmH [Gemmatimonadales bacterium]